MQKSNNESASNKLKKFVTKYDKCPKNCSDVECVKKLFEINGIPKALQAYFYSLKLSGLSGDIAEELQDILNSRYDIIHSEILRNLIEWEKKELERKEQAKKEMVIIGYVYFLWPVYYIFVYN
jgi:hypothetical protein